MSDMLSQEEIDALLSGGSTDNEAEKVKEEAPAERSFTEQEKIPSVK